MGGKRVATRVNQQLAVKMALQGSPQDEIAKAIGTTQASVSRMLSDSDCKAIIDKEHRRLVELAPEIQSRFIELTHSENEKIRLEAIKRAQDIMGIAPSHMQSYFLMAVFGNQDSGLQDAQFRQLAMSFLGLDDPASNPNPSIPIDVTPKDNE
jgi:predicted transcriptional regulator